MGGLRLLGGLLIIMGGLPIFVVENSISMIFDIVLIYFGFPIRNVKSTMSMIHLVTNHHVFDYGLLQKLSYFWLDWLYYFKCVTTLSEIASVISEV